MLVSLGHVLPSEELKLDGDCLAGVQRYPKPITKRQLRGFCRLTGYCCNWIPTFSLIPKPVYEVLHICLSEPLI